MEIGWVFVYLQIKQEVFVFGDCQKLSMGVWVVVGFDCIGVYFFVQVFFGVVDYFLLQYFCQFVVGLYVVYQVCYQWCVGFDFGYLCELGGWVVGFQCCSFVVVDFFGDEVVVGFVQIFFGIEMVDD